MFDEIIAPLFNTDWGRRAGWIAMILMSLLVIFAIFMMFYTWRQDYILSTTQPKQKMNPIKNADADQLIARLPERHLFGYHGMNEELPITSLQLRLIGVIKSEPEKYSRVIISEGGKSGKVYQVGDTLTGSVRINAITPDGVVLENGGRFEKLPLQRAPLEFQGMPKPLLPSDQPLKE